MTHISRQNHAYKNCDETVRTQIKTDMKSCDSDEQPWFYHMEVCHANLNNFIDTCTHKQNSIQQWSSIYNVNI